MPRSPLRLAAALLVAAALTPATALAGWGAAEPVSTEVRSIALAPGGPGFVIGFPAGSPAALRFGLRPLGGTLGPLNGFPGVMGRASLPTLGFDAAGDAVIIDQEEPGVESGAVAYRKADGTLSASQELGLGFYPAAVSVAPTGEALIGLNRVGGDGPVRLMFRPAGLGAQVDTSASVDLSTDGTLVGVQLAADGGAVAVWREGGTLLQTVRRAGETLFDAPTTIAASGVSSGVSLSGDPSGWAMLAWTSGSQVLGSVRAPNGAFPAGTVLATGVNAMNATPAVTASGDGLVAWTQSGLGSPSCPANAIMGARQHLGAWSAPEALGPAAWPDTSILATAGAAFASGNDVSVPMVQIHRDGSPCPTGAQQTRAIIVHHYRSGAAGLTDQGTSVLSAPALGLFPSINGWAMDPAGAIFAWYQDTSGGQRYLRAFDGVTPGAGAAPDGGGTPPAAGTTTPPAATVLPPAAPTVIPKPIAPIKALVLQRFVTIAPIDPVGLAIGMQCPPIGGDNDICAGRMTMLYVFTGKHIKPAGSSARAAAKPKPKTTKVVIASGTLKLKPGKKGKLKLKPTKRGKALLKTGAKLKVILDVTITVGGQKATHSYATTVKARKRR